MTKILKKFTFLISMPFFGILLILLIISMAMATFIESAQGTSAAWALIYDSWWFETIFVLVIINLIGNIVRYKFYKKSKLAVFIFHLAFIIIIVGGGITRFFSSEGMMHIREGAMSGTMISNSSYMDIKISDGDSEVAVSKKVNLSSLTPSKFRWNSKINGKRIKIKSENYIPNAAEKYVAASNGDPYVQLVILVGRQMSIGLKSGEIISLSDMKFSFNNSDNNADLKIFSEDQGLVAYAMEDITLSTMGGDETEHYAAGEAIPLEQGKLFTLSGVRMALQRYLPSAKVQYVYPENSRQGTGYDVTQLGIKMNGVRTSIYLKGGQNLSGEPTTIDLGNTRITCSYGSHNIQLPFVLKLQDFRIARYPGSNSPSSFESDVVLIDTEQNINELHNIYMNNVMKHRGYRFYQTSYDQDEQGTILSVKKDSLGTSVSYFGYLILAIGMILALFVKGTRFAKLSRASGKKAIKAVAVLMLLSIGGSFLNAQNYPAPSKEDAAKFGNLWVQDKEGRFEPMQTLSSEFMRKVLKKSKYNNLNAEQVMLGVLAFPEEWKQAPIFEVDNAELHQMIGYKGSHVCFNDFLANGRYVLANLVNQAYNKQVQERTSLDKEVMKLDEKINVFYMVQTGSLLKIFPDPSAEDGKWLSVADVLEKTTPENDTLGKVFLLYTQALRSNNSGMAGDIVSFIENYQETNTQHVLHAGKKEAEILYNKLDIFRRLIKLYGIFGLTLLILQFFRIFKPGRLVETLYKIDFIGLAVFFVIHTVFFGLRWYVSGHAPLSNGFESMIFISWVAMFAGLIFAGKTGFALPLTAILSTLALLVAHMSWMNPDISNLVPVLKSPWLTIHVTVIMSSYGFLGLSMLLGLTNLIFYIVSNKKNKESIQKTIKQLTTVNHLTLIVGLYCITIGTFLGGVWANESWGKYWGWDPKEVWALISVLVYSFIAHMHYLPGLKGTYAFNLATVFGYSSILMTYFGVNYFLGGMHSYAAGAAFSIPVFVYITVLVLLSVAIIAYRKQKENPVELNL